MGIMTMRDSLHNGLVITINMAGWPYQGRFNSPLSRNSTVMADNGAMIPQSVPITPLVPSVNATSGPPDAMVCFCL